MAVSWVLSPQADSASAQANSDAYARRWGRAITSAEGKRHDPGVSSESRVVSFDLVIPTSGPVLARVHGQGLAGATLKAGDAAARSLPGEQTLALFAIAREQADGPFLLTTADGATHPLKPADPKVMASAAQVRGERDAAIRRAEELREHLDDFRNRYGALRHELEQTRAAGMEAAVAREETERGLTAAQAQVSRAERKANDARAAAQRAAAEVTATTEAADRRAEAAGVMARRELAAAREEGENVAEELREHAETQRVALEQQLASVQEVSQRSLQGLRDRQEDEVGRLHVVLEAERERAEALETELRAAQAALEAAAQTHAELERARAAADGGREQAERRIDELLAARELAEREARVGDAAKARVGQLESHVSSLEGDFSRLRERLQTAEADHETAAAALRDKVAQTERALGDAQREVATRVTAGEGLTESRRLAESRVEELEAELSAAKAVGVEHQVAASTAQTLAEDLRRGLDDGERAAQQELASVRDALATAETALATVQEQRAAVVVQRDGARVELAEVMEERDGLRRASTATRNELVAVRGALDDTRAVSEAVQAELELARKEQAAVVEDLAIAHEHDGASRAALSNLLEQHAEEIEKVEAARAAATAHAQAQEVQAGAAEAAASAAQDESEAAVQALAAAESELRAAQGERDDIAERVALLEVELTERANDTELAEEHIARLSGEMALLTDRATVLEVELAERSADLAAAVLAREQTDEHRFQLESRLLELDASRADAQDAIDALQRESEERSGGA